MSIADWPAGERPREKLLARGPGVLSDAELIAIFLRTGTRGKTAVDISRELLQVYGGIRGVLTADQRTACSQAGFGRIRYATLQAVLELGRRYLAERMREVNALTSPQAARTYLKSCLRDRPYEVFGCLYLDTKHRPISFEELFRGTIDGASVYPREVVRTVLANNAAAVILAHNHPSGVAEPSSADQSLTHRLKAALALVDVRLIDHIIVGDGESVSFSERGLL
ncbi:DNA repair protein RadC [Gammaproteobacteria bacterium]|nr:DNA repair protein RadC [Gammaproteobacteria bacterium]